MTQENLESKFNETINNIKDKLSEFNNYDLVVGIPFYNEAATLGPLLQSIDQVLRSWIGRRQLMVFVGDYSANECLKVIQQTDLTHPHIEFLLPAEISGRGMAVRSIIEISKRLDADLLLFSANMANDHGPGIDESWLEGLLTPIQGHYDLVLGSMRRYLGIDSIAHMMAAPILETFYGFRVGDPLGGIYAISHNFIEELSHDARYWGRSISGFGIDFWIITRALCSNKNICEVNMGGNIHEHNLQTRNRIFYETAQTIFEAIRRDVAIWMQDRLIVRVADILARSEIKRPDLMVYSLPDLLDNFRKGCLDNKIILNKCERARQILKLVEDEDKDFYLTDELWVSTFFDLLQAYAFDDEEMHIQILSLLTALYNGRIASYLVEMNKIQTQMGMINGNDQNEMMAWKMESIRQNLTNVFWQMKPTLSRQWINKQELCRPPLVPFGYMEYVPGKPIVIPKRIVGCDKCIVQTDNIFRELRKRYDNRFNNFITHGLSIAHKAGATDIIKGVEGFMQRLEQALEEILPGDLTTEEGMQQFIDGLFSLYPQHRMYTINSDLMREMLVRFPPINMMIPLGYYKAEQLIANMDPRDAVTYANMVETWTYTDRDLIWLVDNLTPESFEWVDIKPLVLKDEMRIQMGMIPPGKISNLNRVTARIVVKCLEPGQGGKYARLRYFTALLRRLAVAEDYSELFLSITAERKNTGLKMRNALLGFQKGDELSAYNIFENYHHRKLVGKIRLLATNLAEQGKHELARLFNLAVDGYGLGEVLENGIFLTCTAWSWASYSSKGGLNIPTPLTTSVESRWFNHDFLEVMYKELGYDPDEIMDIVFRLLHEGKNHHNLMDTLLPTRPKDVMVVIQESTNEPSKHLQRYSGNPILEPIANSVWESKYVLNPGALRIGDKVYLFYRAVGEDDISHIGLAVTDGFKVLERIPEPVFSPLTPEEKMGCEDPRLTLIDNRIFMIYTAYDGNVAQIAAASMQLHDFMAGNYTAWKREGLAFKNIWDKDAILFPEKINGKYIIYHRIEPSIWLTYLNELKFPIKEKHAIIIGPRPGRMWDSLKVGAGAQPLKTRYGWLLIYHGVDYNYVYRLGVILVDLHNPTRVIFRSPNPILEPEEDYEIGLNGAWVPNVVFTCGAVAGSDKEVLDDDDEILVYYGAADTSIGVAKATLADLIPEKFRNH